uniref:Ig-like domain-containing protein n=1 Tax=Lates calcarifer TaxID=8187 RepID=A0A4W6FB87_LATCA
MLVIFCLVLMLRMGRCTGKQIETKTVRVGDDVHLTCPRIGSGTLFWIRLVSGNLPKILGKTYSYEPDPRITATEGHGTFDLHIGKAKLSDAAVYYCVKTQQGELIFLEGTDLRVEGKYSKNPTVSDPVRPGDSVTLQCSVLSESENKTCPGDHSVYWFRAGSDKSHPEIIYTDGNDCEKRSDSLKSCVYHFSKNVSSSDSGTYYCAVATCGEIIFGDGTKLEIEVGDIKHNLLLLIKNKCDCCSGKISNSYFSIPKYYIEIVLFIRYEDMLVYSAVIFTMMKDGGGAIKDVKAAERERIYAAVKAFGLD